MRRLRKPRPTRRILVLPIPDFDHELEDLATGRPPWTQGGISQLEYFAWQAQFQARANTSEAIAGSRNRFPVRVYGQDR